MQQIKQNTNIKIYKLEKRMNFRYTLNTIFPSNYLVSVLIIIIIIIIIIVIIIMIVLLVFFFFLSFTNAQTTELTGALSK